MEIIWTTHSYFVSANSKVSRSFVPQGLFPKLLNFYQIFIKYKNSVKDRRNRLSLEN